MTAVSLVPAGPGVQVTPQGHRLEAAWRPVAGATAARVTSSVVEVLPPAADPAFPAGFRGRSLGVVRGARTTPATAIDVVSPDARIPLHALRIPALRLDGTGDVLTDERLRAAGLRLTVAPVVDGVTQAPVVAVRAVDPQGTIPLQLTGASLSGNLLVLPDLAGSRWRVQLVEKDGPADFAARRFTHGDVTMYAPPGPVGLHVDDPTGQEQQALVGPVRELVRVDVTASVNRHLGSVATDDPIRSSVTVRSDVEGSSVLRWSLTGGVVERAVAGRLSVEVEGRPTEVALPPPHPGRQPLRTRADVTVRHHGMATHPLSDPVPAADADLGGPLVRDEPVVRALPPQALRGQVLRRVGVIGWAHGPTDLSLAVGGGPAPVTVAATDLVPPADRQPAALVWFDVGELAVEGPLRLALSATRGRFAWVADPEPLVRLAVAVGPQGERVRVGDAEVPLTAEETLAPQRVLEGTDRWSVQTDQFCTVSLTRTVLEFAP